MVFSLSISDDVDFPKNFAQPSNHSIQPCVGHVTMNIQSSLTQSLNLLLDASSASKAVMIVTSFPSQLLTPPSTYQVQFGSVDRVMKSTIQSNPQRAVQVNLSLGINPKVILQYTLLYGLITKILRPILTAKNL